MNWILSLIKLYIYKMYVLDLRISGAAPEIRQGDGEGDDAEEARRHSLQVRRSQRTL